jgi:acetoin utilization deacetylase AcuC-like enzyme
VRIVYHDRYREVYSSDPASEPGRIESIVKELKGHFDFVQPEPAFEEEILLVHTRPHVERVKATPLAYEIALLAAGGTEKAAEIALNGEPAFALVRPPGHHASRASSWGFCYFNNVALAIEQLRFNSRIKTALIIDIDLHYGDGTADIFSGSTNVTYFHPEVSNRQGYLDELKRYLGVLHETFDMLAVSAGFDRHEQDWGGMLKTEDYLTIGKMVKQFAESRCNRKRFAVLEGGYSHSVLGKNVKALLDGMT